MLTFRGKTETIHYNSDLSGELIVVQHDGDQELARFSISAEFLLEFLTEYIRKIKIAKVKEATLEDLLKI